MDYTNTGPKLVKITKKMAPARVDTPLAGPSNEAEVESPLAGPSNEAEFDSLPAESSNETEVESPAAPSTVTEGGSPAAARGAEVEVEVEAE